MKGEDEGVKIQQKNREELGRVLDAYGLTAYDEMGPVHSDRHFEDPMKLKDNDLIEIWKNARQSQKFSEDELKSLWRELLDHKTQLDEYRSNEKVFVPYITIEILLLYIVFVSINSKLSILARI
jgi:hypothetical protein